MHQSAVICGRHVCFFLNETAHLLTVVSPHAHVAPVESIEYYEVKLGLTSPFVQDVTRILDLAAATISRVVLLHNTCPQNDRIKIADAQTKRPGC